MKILIVTQYFWPEAFQINNLAQELSESGHEITVLTGKPNYPLGNFYPGYGFFKKTHELFKGIKIWRSPLIKRGKGTSIRLALNYLSFAFFASFIFPWVSRRDKYDVIFIFIPSPITAALPAIVLKKLKKIPTLIWVQDIWPETLAAVNAIKSPRILKLLEKLTKFIYHHCDKILVQSKAFIPAIERLGILQKKIHYFPNAADDSYECGLINSHEHSLPDGFRIIYGGNVAVAQSFETILEAAKLLKEHVDIQWIIIGDGRKKQWLADQIEKHSLSHCVHLLGRKPAEEMPSYFNRADALLVSLKKDPVFALTIPSKLQSYLACGKPVIASLDGEAARIVEESRAGLVSPAEDAKALANNVLTIYNADDLLREEMGKNARSYFETHFEKKKLRTQLESWMHELI